MQSAARALSILSAVAASSYGLTAAEIAEEVGLKIATTYHLVHTLIGEGFLVSSGERRYRLGFRVGGLVDGFERQVVPADLVQFAQQLASTTGETAYVSFRRQARTGHGMQRPGRSRGQRPSQHGRADRQRPRARERQVAPRPCP